MRKDVGVKFAHEFVVSWVLKGVGRIKNLFIKKINFLINTKFLRGYAL